MTKPLRIFFLVAAGMLVSILVLAQAASAQTPAQTSAQTNHAGPQTTTPPSASPSTPTPAPPPASVTATPLISPADRAEFFKRQLALIQAQQAVDRAQAGFQKAVEQLQKDCGGVDGKFLPQIDQAGDPVCQARVAMPKP